MSVITSPFPRIQFIQIHVTSDDPAEDHFSECADTTPRCGTPVCGHLKGLGMTSKQTEYTTLLPPFGLTATRKLMPAFEAGLVWPLHNRSVPNVTGRQSRIPTIRISGPATAAVLCIPADLSFYYRSSENAHGCVQQSINRHRTLAAQ